MADVYTGYYGYATRVKLVNGVEVLREPNINDGSGNPIIPSVYDVMMCQTGVSCVTYPVTNLRLTTLYSTEVTIEWDAVPTADHYEWAIYREGVVVYSGDFPSNVVAIPFSELSPEYQYRFTIRSVCANGTTSNTSSVEWLVPLKAQPNVITPNGDGINDRFFVMGINRWTNVTFTIFNRWGNLIYQKTNYSNAIDAWDGYNVNSGTYYWEAVGTNLQGFSETKKGSVDVLK